MQQFIKRFVRETKGVWCCVAPAELILVQGPINVVPGTRLISGTSFMGVDLAGLLEDEYTRAQPIAAKAR